MVMAVKVRAEPSAGRVVREEMVRRWSSRRSGRDCLAVSRIGFRASAKGSLTSPVA